MAAGKISQTKTFLKLSKELPSNIQIIKQENRDKRDQQQSNIQVKQKQIDPLNFDENNLPLFKYVDHEKWRILYTTKLKFCHKIADFGDNQKDSELKEKKKETLIELIDVLEEPAASQHLMNEHILKESLKMIEANIFRTFTNKGNPFFNFNVYLVTKKTSSVDPDEDEPHLEEAWPHLQLIYELLLKFIMTQQIPSSTIASCISNSFLKQMIELFDSEDPRERDYLKTILHRIYGKFMQLRNYIRKQVMNLLLKITYEQENHNGLTELFEILSSVASGFAIPLKEEHQSFFLKVLVPQHKVKQLSNFNTQLQSCIKTFLEKENSLAIPLIKGLLRFWPITNPAKEVIFLNEIEEILDQFSTVCQQNFQEYGLTLLKRMIRTSQSMHYQAAERALLMLNSETIQKHVKQNKSTAYPIVVKSLIQGSQSSHWNQTVTTITYSVMRTYMEMDPENFEKFTTQAQNEEKNKLQKEKEIENKWKKLEKKFGK